MKKRVFSRILSLVLTALMLVGALPIAVWAESSDFSYYTSYDGVEEYAIINGYFGEGGTVIVPAEIDGYPVRQIGYGVFDSRTDIDHVTFSEGIEHLSGNVFSWSSVKSVSLPSTLKSISSQCFYFSDIVEITIPESVTMLGAGIFEGCEYLTDVYFEAKTAQADWEEGWADGCFANIWYGGRLVSSCVTEGDLVYRIEGIRASVVDYIGEEWGCEVIVPAKIDNAVVTEIGTQAFKDSYGIFSISLPDTVTKIGNDAFISCGDLREINIPFDINYIGYRAFMWCGSLEKLYIPSDVSYIGNMAFAYIDAIVYMEASEPSEGWDESWADGMYIDIVWGACIHRNTTLDELQKTCESDGYRRVTCDACGEVLSYETYIGGHEFEYGVCMLCGTNKNSFEEYSYWYGEEGIYISDYCGTDKKILIPAEIGGTPVVGIDNGAFDWCENLQGVIIPEGVRSIGQAAFYHCTSLTSVVLPSTLEWISAYAFENTGLTEITIPAGVVYVGAGAFNMCNALTDVYCGSTERMGKWDEGWLDGCEANTWCGDTMLIGRIGEYRVQFLDGAVAILSIDRDAVAGAALVIPSEMNGMPVTRIEACAFNGNDIKSVTLPDTLEYIGVDAFGYSYALEEITIPASVLCVDYGAFRECDNLRNIYCEASEQPEGWSEGWTDCCYADIYFGGMLTQSVVDNFAISIKNGEVFILDYADYSAQELIIPDTLLGYPVTTIEQNAFADRYNLQTVVLPETVTTIGNYAFAWCYALEEITIPANVLHMGYDVFWECHDMKNIYCEAAVQPEQWDRTWAEGCDATIYFDGVMVRGTIDGFVFYTEDGMATITNYVGDATMIDIPRELGGYPVTRIESNAFDELDEVTSITIPDTVNYIGSYAFAWSYALGEITIPASVTDMGGCVFAGSGVQNIYCAFSYPQEGWDYEWANGCAANIWYNGVLQSGVVDGFYIGREGDAYLLLGYFGDATEVVIPAEFFGYPVIAIENNAFSSLELVTSVIIPDTVTYIGYNAFAGTYALEEITIPAGVTDMGNSVFADSGVQNIYCQAEYMPDGWSYDWANGCSASIYFGGALTQGMIDGFVFRIENGEAVIAKYNNYDTAEITIPRELNGYPVTGIENNAFANLSNVGRIIIPDTVTYIDYYAFAYCYNLTEITIPASMQVMGDSVFWECYNLQNIYCEASEQPDGWSYDWANGCGANIYFDGVMTQGSIDGFVFCTENGSSIILDYVDYEAVEIVIPSTLGGYPVTKIAGNAFANLYNAGSITIPDTVTYIGYEAFAYCYNLTEITIPASVQAMGGSVFWECNNLQNIYCEASEQPEEWFYDWANGCSASVWFDGVMKQGVIDGFLFRTENGSSIILDYTDYSAFELIIPDTLGGCPVTKIENNAFADMYNLSSVIIPDTVTYIGHNAFAWCYSLTEITIPASVQVMEGNVFWECHNLQNIYCEASEQPDEWAYDWTNGCSANIYFDGVMMQGVIDGFLFRIENGEAVIAKYNNYGTAEITIPRELNGYPVTKIENNVFANLSNVEKIIIPDTVTYIGYEAFAYCYSLTEITIPASVQVMESDVFWECYNLQNIYCEASEQPDEWLYSWANGCSASIWFDGVMKQGVIDGFVFRIENGEAVIAKYNNYDTAEIIIPRELNGYPVTKIENNAFAEMYNLSSVIIPDTVTYIGYEAFAWCYGLTEITIPASVQVMENNVFWDCNNLQNIYCEASEQPKNWNEYWANGCSASIWFDGVMKQGVIDGFVFRVENGSAIILNYVDYEAVEIVIPDTLGGCPVTMIENNAFADLYILSSVIIPDTVTYIGYHAFAWCYNLTEITIPASVQVMGDSVFWACNNLQNIYCEASEQPKKWSYSWANGCGANIYFDGVIMQGTIDWFVFRIENGSAIILDYVDYEAVEIVIPSTLGGCPVTGIERNAFSDLYNAGSITIPDTVTYIGAGAFAYCYNLTEITIPASVQVLERDMFWECPNLQNIYCEASEQPDEWSYDWANGCGANIYFDGVMTQGSIDGFLFRVENGEIILLEYYGEESYFTIPSELMGYPVTTIDAGAFAYNEYLIEVTIPASVQVMENNVFLECPNLQNIYCEASELPENWFENWADDCGANIYFDGVFVQGIREDYKIRIQDGEIILLEYYGSEMYLTVPSELLGCPVTGISYEAFAYNEYLIEVTIPASITRMDNDVFWECHNLQNIYCEASELPQGWSYYWANGTDATVYFDGELAQGVFDGFFVRIEDGGAVILRYTGESRYEMNIPAEICGYPVTRIESNAFADNYDFGIVVIPDTVKYIGYEAFAYCRNLTEITIPASVQVMENDVFWSCENLQNIYCEASERPEGWANFWINGCNANVWFDGVMQQGIFGEFKVRLENGEAYIIGYVGDGKEVVIPSQIEGMPVVEIGDSVFAGSSVISVQIPATVRLIGMYAFEYSMVQSIFLDASAPYEDWGFGWLICCYADVWCGDTLLNVWENGMRVFLNKYEAYILDYTGDASVLVIPETICGKPVTIIADRAFADSYTLTEVVVPSTVVGIGNGAFMYCGELRKVVLNEGLYWISSEAFAMTGLEEIVLPSTLAEIGGCCFVDTKLTEITIPYGVQFVGFGAFMMVHSLKTIYCEIESMPESWDDWWLDDCWADVIWAVKPCLHENTSVSTEQPTCGRDGYERTVCDDCGRTIAETIFPATGDHDMEYPMVGGPDCESWSITYPCKNCEYTETLTVVGVDHVYGEDGYCIYGCERRVDVVLSVTDAAVKKGETFTVDLLVDFSAGFTYLGLDIFYDSDVLELVSVSNGELFESMTQGYHCIWANWQNITASGVLCTLTFSVKEDAVDGQYSVSVSVIECSDENEQDCTIAHSAGTITVQSAVYGDCNGDGKVNGRDVTRLLQYLANLDPFTGESSVEVSAGADCNGDGKVNGKDVTRLLQYLANLDPLTGESSVVLGPNK